MSEVFALPKDSNREPVVSRLAKFLLSLPAAKAWRVTVDEAKSARSVQQNNYLHGVCYKRLSDAIGYEPEEVAEYLCGTYFGWAEKRVPKKPSNPEGIESVPRRTTTKDEMGKRDVLGKMAFAEYVAFIQRFAISKGVHIPDPDEI